MKWTTEQQNAIDSRQGTILVSAAAGSGKTAVLVERIMERITDKNVPCNIDELLVVTFTKAAASQMRDRISKKISERIIKDPTDKNLLKQQRLLPFAKISTIDSFCIDLLRENFSQAGISPDFTLMDDNENSLLKSQIAAEVVEEMHLQASEGFLNLSEHLINAKNADSKLVEMIIKLYEIAQSHPFPEKYLDLLLENYGSGEIFKEEILSQVIKILEYCKLQSDIAIETALGDECITEAYLPALEADKRMIETFIKEFEKSDWDTMAYLFKDISFQRFSSVKRGYASKEKDKVMAIRGEYKAFLNSLSSYFIADEITCDEAIKATEPIIAALVEAVKLFSYKINEVKRNTNKFYFSDVLHLAINMLTDGENKTQIAKDISETLKEIMIDEYQDTNKAQDMLFSAISKDESNLFMVGDVKQSIYRFRQAMPEIFLERRSKMEKYSSDNYPAKIFLDRNFRSRKGVIDGINFIFRQIMSDSVGDVDYNDDEALVYAAGYEEKNEADTEILFIKDLRFDENEEAIEVEGKVIADKIHSIVGKLEITDGDIKRKADYGDIAILMRSLATKGDKLAKVLSNEGIPAYSEKSNSLFEAFEVNVFLSLLQIIDNPLQDIPLLSVMLSPIFGFTPDDIAKLRIDDRKSSVYACILKSDDEKCKEFLNKIKHFRNLSLTMSAESFCRRLLDETAYATMILSMKNGKNRLSNVLSLQSYAKAFDENSEGGFGSFVRYLEKIKNQGSRGGKGEAEAQKNAVSIMTIHKSKGLEFPVCILANCSNKFNSNELSENLLVHPKLGVGCVARDVDRLVQYDTISHKAVAMATRKTDISEEMRLLYVAMTRAKEKLICTLMFNNPEKKLLELSVKVGQEKRIPELVLENSLNFSTWIAMAALRHPGARKIREELMLDVKELPSDSPMHLEIIYPDTDVEDFSVEQSESTETDEELIARIEEAANYKYPYSQLSEVLAKISASELSSEYNYRDYFAASKPKFLNDDKLTGAERGTATHTFMQYADYTKAKSEPEAHAKELVEEGFISQQQLEAIDFIKVKNFFNSSLGIRLMQSDKVYKEKRFIINIPITDVYKDLTDEMKNEKVLVQGVLDCAFEENGEIVLLDYKTDRVKNESELVSRYSEQLMMYKKALEITMGKPVSQTFLYSFSLDKEIELK